MTIIETTVMETMRENFGLLKNEITELCRQSEGKILYRESDIERLLQLNYVRAFE